MDKNERERIRMALNDALKATKIPKPEEGIPISEVHKDYPFVVVSRALEALGVQQRRARILAGKYPGCAHCRWNKLLNELGMV